MISCTEGDSEPAFTSFKENRSQALYVLGVKNIKASDAQIFFFFFFPGQLYKGLVVFMSLFIN